MALELCWAGGDGWRRCLPGDKFVPHPVRAIVHTTTINAAPEAVGARVNQTGGPPRACYYGYTWIDRLRVLEIGNLAWRLPVYYGRFQRQKEGRD